MSLQMAANADRHSVALEDKEVQQALVEVLQAVYEEDFIGFSYRAQPEFKLPESFLLVSVHEDKMCGAKT